MHGCTSCAAAFLPQTFSTPTQTLTNDTIRGVFHPAVIRFSRKNIKLNVYLAAVMDLYKREVIGYSVSRNIDTELVCRALGNALHRKRKNETPIFHSDRGSQYSSDRYQAMLTQNKLRVEHE